MADAIPLRNPRSGAFDGEVAVPDRAELQGRAQTLRAGQLTWQSRGVQGRAAALRDWADGIESTRHGLVDALVRDTGRLAESILEVDATVRMIRRWAELATQLLQAEERRPTSIPTVTLEQTVEPYPLVGVISPWNFPLLLSLIDAVPALLAGSAALLKPSEVTPRFIEPLVSGITSLPELDAVLDVVPGGPDTGRELIELADAICFTGSVATGRAVAAAAATRLIPAYLELGGKDPAIVVETADLDHAARALVWGSTANAGQSCLSIERIYVAATVHDALVDRLVDLASQLPLAYPGLEDGVIGPIIAERQVAVIRAHIEDALAKGAVARCGGRIEKLDGGVYVRPTVLTGVDHSMRVMAEETFGPIMPVMPFDTLDEAIGLANATEFGLSAAVFAGTDREALAVARRIEAGAISINDAALTAIVYDGEKHAFKSSGLGGSRMGAASLRRFLRRRAFLINEQQTPQPWWYALPVDTRGGAQ